MIFPLIKHEYLYNNEIVYVWHQIPLFSVFLKTMPKPDEKQASIFFKENWFKFMLRAKKYDK